MALLGSMMMSRDAVAEVIPLIEKELGPVAELMSPAAGRAAVPAE